MANIKKYDYEKICLDLGYTYINECNPYIWFKDEFGFLHKMTRTNLAYGNLPSAKSVVDSKTEYSIFMLKQRYPNIEDVCSFEKYEYKTALTYTTVVCREHGEYRTKPNWLMSRGNQCQHCAIHERSKKQNLGADEFIRRSKLRFGELYDYSKVEYLDCRKSVKLVCKKHGDFEVIAYQHSNGEQGCQKCGKEVEREFYANNHSNGSSVYLLKMTSKDSEFYKIGLSSRVNKRVCDIARESSCVVEIVYKQHFNDPMEAWDTEETLLLEFKDMSYKPKETFRGYTECFKFDDIDNVVKIMKSIC